MHHTTPKPSAPTHTYGAPPIPTPARGRCALCTLPIREGESAKHIPVHPDFVGPVPYQHTECPA